MAAKVSPCRGDRPPSRLFQTSESTVHSAAERGPRGKEGADSHGVTGGAFLKHTMQYGVDRAQGTPGAGTRQALTIGGVTLSAGPGVLVGARAGRGSWDGLPDET